uniref:Uncharacterized protein n=1 Tax=Anguilla anguilla TaxID=7936 RepID=A0A0E9XB69_ANGAN
MKFQPERSSWFPCSVHQLAFFLLFALPHCKLTQKKHHFVC